MAWVATHVSSLEVAVAGDVVEVEIGRRVVRRVVDFPLKTPGDPRREDGGHQAQDHHLDTSNEPQ